MTTPPTVSNLVGLQKTIRDRLMYRRPQSTGPTVERRINDKTQNSIDRKKGLEGMITKETSRNSLMSSLWNALRLSQNDERHRFVSACDVLCSTARTAETLSSRDSRNMTKSSEISTNDMDDLNFDNSDQFEGIIRKSQSMASRYNYEMNDDKDECNSMKSDKEEIISSKLNNYIIYWSDISFPSHIQSNKIIIGKGSYGTVLRALWTKDGNEKEVAIKIQTIPNTKTKSDFHKVRCQTKREVQVMITARDRVPDKSVVTEAYGMIEGSLPPQIATLLKRTNPDDIAVGIVMEYESGGSLEQYLSRYNKSSSPSSSPSSSSSSSSSLKTINVIPLKEKFRLLVEISRSIHALHSVGIVHADIKAANVLLSGDILHPRPRLSDFGMSLLLLHHERKDNGEVEMNHFESRSSRHMTSKHHSHGTKAFCAPEMLINPYKQGMLKTNMMCNKEAADFLNTIAKPSRTTDMYAFGLLAWQILSQRQPFAEITSEAMLVSKVHKDYRPDVSKCPPETPNEVISMIQSCWHGDGEKRKTAGECFAILERHYFSLPYINPTDESSLNISAVSSLMSSQEIDISADIGVDNNKDTVGNIDWNSTASAFNRCVIDQLLLYDDNDSNNSDGNNNDDDDNNSYVDDDHNSNDNNNDDDDDDDDDFNVPKKVNEKINNDTNDDDDDDNDINNDSYDTHDPLRAMTVLVAEQPLVTSAVTSNTSCSSSNSISSSSCNNNKNSMVNNSSSNNNNNNNNNNNSNSSDSNNSNSNSSRSSSNTITNNNHNNSHSIRSSLKVNHNSSIISSPSCHYSNK